MTLAQLIGDALSIELGSDDTTELFTTARRTAAVNAAQREWVRLTESFVREGSVALSDGVATYDVETALSDFIRLSKQGPAITVTVSGTITATYAGDDLPRRDILWLDRYTPGWRQEPAGVPSRYYLQTDGGGHVIGLVPAPSIAAGETWALVVPYVAVVADLSDAGDVPFTVDGDPLLALEPYHQALVHFAASTLERARKDYQASDYQLQKFLGYVQDYLQTTRVRGGRTIGVVRDYLGERPAEGFAGIVQGDPRV
jgi:hypothetical protein